VAGPGEALVLVAHVAYQLAADGPVASPLRMAQIDPTLLVAVLLATHLPLAAGGYDQPCGRISTPLLYHDEEDTGDHH
jgi:hypothetical protein